MRRVLFGGIVPKERMWALGILRNVSFSYFPHPGLQIFLLSSFEKPDVLLY